MATKRAFERKGIAPDMIDVSAGDASREFLLGLGHRQLPVVIAGDTHWSGFDPAKIASC
ncbi:glutaredoxin family protein [Rhizobium leguminosarum]|uniref:glutaredoxin family protein n=1 Tax=Rhizobium leguminosarum TaxID=384 RepID=UPI0032B0223F